MDAWEILSGGSTEPLTADTWTHLNNQEGGGGFEQLFMTPVDFLNVNIQEQPMPVVFNDLVLSVDYPIYVAGSSTGNLELKLEILK